MNTTNTQNSTLQHGEKINKMGAINTPPGNKEKENPLKQVYEAEIITPQPYGVFALCKLMEHFQIN